MANFDVIHVKINCYKHFLVLHMKKVHKIYKHLMEVEDRGIPTIATQESAIERYPDYLNQRKDTPVTMEIIQE